MEGCYLIAGSLVVLQEQHMCDFIHFSFIKPLAQ